MTEKFNSYLNLGQSDLETALINRKLKNGIMSREASLLNAADVVNYLSAWGSKLSDEDREDEDREDELETVENRNLLKVPTRMYELIKEGDFERKDDDVKTLSGGKTRKLHCIFPAGVPGNLKYRLHSCFCVNCKKEEYGDCTNKDFTKGHFTYGFVTKSGKEVLENEMEEGMLIRDASEGDEGPEDDYLIHSNSSMDIEKLNEKDFILVRIRDKSSAYTYVARVISTSPDTNAVIVDYYKKSSYGRAGEEVFQKFDHPDYVDVEIDGKDVVCVLPEPEPNSKSKTRELLKFRCKLNVSG